MKKEILKYIPTLLAMLLIFSLFLCSCGNKDDDTVTSSEQEEAIVYEEEDEDAELTFEKHENKDFYGTWTADSDQAEYLYGNLDITVKKNNTWKGNIVGDDYEGTWAETDNGIRLSSDWVEFELTYSESGKMILREIRDEDDSNEEEDYINTVMTKK